ncbi:MAG: FHA domain-containing protein [Solirubrobacterales bacterium]
MISAVTQSHEAGTSPGTGTYSCTECGAQVSLDHLDELPECPRCDTSTFHRSSIFDPPPAEPRSPTVEFLANEGRPVAPDWLEEARGRLPGSGRYLVCKDADLEIFPLEEGWTRIGRSSSADVRLDDPSVSRRHALIVWEPGEELRVLDDRSLNGIWLNGAVVDWGTIAEGDELLIGRYRLYLLGA